jgi:hypothetical protein
MWQIDKLVSGDVAPGVYRFAGSEHRANMQEELLIFGWQLFYLDGRPIRDKESFIREAGEAMGFPDYSGKNWDAFEEMIRDLSWNRAQGYALLYEYPHHFSETAPDEWATALSILRNACQFWADQGTPMYVLLRRVDGHLQEIPLL